MLFSFVLGISVTLGSGAMLVKSGVLTLASPPTLTSKTITTPNQTWNTPASFEQGFSFVAPLTKNLVVYNISKNKLLETGLTVNCCGGAQYLGEMEVKPSPNLYLTAFIDTSSGKLGILSNQSLKHVLVPGTEGVKYISAWAPDSSRLLIYFPVRNIDVDSEEIMMPEQTKRFDKNIKRGFYVVDLIKHTLIEVYPVTGSVGFLSPNEILVRSDASNYRITLFNIDTFEADTTRLKDSYPFGTGQFDIARDGKTWAFITSDKPTDDSKIVWAQFPNKAGEVVDAGGWSDNQWPKISPDGTKIAYQKYRGNIDVGIPAPNVWVYRNKIKAEVAPGKPLQWVDNANLVVERNLKNETTTKREYGILNIDTGSYIKMY